MGRKKQDGIPGVDVRENSIRLTFTTADGVRHRKTLTVNGRPLAPTTPNIKAAARQVAEIRQAIRLGVFSMATYFPAEAEAEAEAAAAAAAAAAAEPSLLTVAKQLDIWESGLRVEKSTRAGYQSAMRFWKRVPYERDNPALLADLPLQELKLSHVKTAIASCPNLLGKTINNYVTVLRKAIALAVSDGVLSRNPADNHQDLRAKHQRQPPDPFSAREVDRMLAYHRQQHPDAVANLVEFWAYTGLRTSEIAGLKWDSVDWDQRSVRIHRANVRGHEKDKTKTATVRDVHLNGRAWSALLRQKVHTHSAGEHVFLDPRKQSPWNEERAFRRSFWTPALKKLEMRYRRPYNLRHSYATLLLMSGATPAWAAKQLGHGVDVFLSTYAKWIDDGHSTIEEQKVERFLTANAEVIRQAREDLSTPPTE